MDIPTLLVIATLNIHSGLVTHIEPIRAYDSTPLCVSVLQKGIIEKPNKDQVKVYGCMPLVPTPGDTKI